MPKTDPPLFSGVMPLSSRSDGVARQHEEWRSRCPCGKRIGSRSGLSQTFNKIMAASGVSRGKPSRSIKEGENIGKGRINYERGFHSLRHTFTTWLRSAGVSEEDRMALTGHSTRESHQTYSHTDETSLHDAISKLPKIDS